MLYAQKICERDSLNFSDLFAHQFVLCRNPEGLPGDWTVSPSINGWILGHCPGLDRQEILDASGRCLGWLLGVAVDPDGKVFSKCGVQFDFSLSDAGWP